MIHKQPALMIPALDTSEGTNTDDTLYLGGHVMRRHEPFVRELCPRPRSISTLIDQGRQHDARVDDEGHVRSAARSASISSADRRLPRAFERAAARSSSSSTVGRAAKAMNSRRRNSCNDCPALAARPARTSRTPSGTFRIVMDGMHAFCCCCMHYASAQATRQPCGWLPRAPRRPRHPPRRSQTPRPPCARRRSWRGRSRGRRGRACRPAGDRSASGRLPRPAPCASRGGTSSPVRPLSIISGTPPTCVATTGRRNAIASRIARPCASRYDGRTATSSAAVTAGTSSRSPVNTILAPGRAPRVPTHRSPEHSSPSRPSGFGLRLQRGRAANPHR